MTETGTASVTGSPGPLPEFARRARAIRGSPIDSSISLLQKQSRPIIPFATGCPGADALPAREMADIAASVLAETSASALNYGPTEGEPRLRRALLDWLGAAAPAPIPEDELLITTGGMQGLDLVCKLFIDSGDVAVIEDPAYPNTVSVVEGYGGRCHAVPVDGQGMVVEVLDRAMRDGYCRPKLIFVVPNFQNPAGVSLGPARRQRLLELAGRYGALIVEDDPYRELYLGPPSPPGFRALDGGRGRVVTVGTFAKILSPGLRVGWVAGPQWIIRRMIDARQGMDTCAGVLGQRMIGEFLARGNMSAHLARLRNLYRDRRDAMVSALEQCFGGEDGFAWNVPAGGFFLWLTLPPAVDADVLLPIALEEGVAFIPGGAFSRSGRFRNAVRLCFANPPLGEIGEGIARLSRSIDRYHTQADRR